MPGCYPYGVRAMWSERSRHMRGGAVLGSSGKVAGLAVRLLARDMRLTGAKAAGEETHSRASNLPTGPQDDPAAHMAASLRPHGSHPIRVAAWHLELRFGGPGRVETPRSGPEKLRGG